MEGQGTYACAAELHTQIDTTSCSTDRIDNDLQDIFGSLPDSPINMAGGIGSFEHSDIPRLKSKHETNGYREGISLGKEKTVQRGFDEGFGLGAVIGMRIGVVLGLLEGVTAGLGLDNTENASEAERMYNLLQAAEAQLSIRSVFGAKWWGEDGAWRYNVPGETEGDASFYEVAKAHPLLKKWETLVEVEIQKWNLDLKIFDANDISRCDELSASNHDSRELTKQTDLKKGLAAPEAQARVADDLTLIKADLKW